ncbi:hypothetical protein [Peribacillus butanolivorans]|uniref:Uncharacterized protein n=1 Tax=Peribacillus butanolivorans TaxID=421767 RepID=A0ABM6XQ21_9BACI|nr:hypothetical protein [Peribacillus butanolivorans]AXN40695.1 hypothetical protein DTO10_21480 [Peribacillus butanolivorans]
MIYPQSFNNPEKVQPRRDTYDKNADVQQTVSTVTIQISPIFIPIIGILNGFTLGELVRKYVLYRVIHNQLFCNTVTE